MVVAGPRYEVICPLAGGGMAELHLARVAGPAGFERLVVVKRLASQLVGDPGAAQALLDEARIAATLQHANIVQVHDVEITGGHVSIAMEFLHGHDVRDLRRRLDKVGDVVPLDQAIAIAIAVCSALHHAHERVDADGRPLGIVHRDVSPHNVLVTYDGAVKLVDFGIARAATRAGRTEQGVIKGKPGYMAPEQVRGRTADRRADIWATAVLLYEMTTGSAPFGDGEPFDILRATVESDPMPPSQRVRDYPPALEQILRRGMARDVADRYATADAMRVDLEELARALRLDLSPSGLAGLMERVFASQLASWRKAQREGRSLAEHVAALRTSRAFDVVDGKALDATLDATLDGALEARSEVRPDAASDRSTRTIQPGHRRSWRIPVAIAFAAVVAAVAVALLASARGPSKTREASTRDARASAPGVVVPSPAAAHVPPTAEAPPASPPATQPAGAPETTPSPATVSRKSRSRGASPSPSPSPSRSPSPSPSPSPSSSPSPSPSPPPPDPDAPLPR